MTEHLSNSRSSNAARRTLATRLRPVLFLGVLVIGVVLGMSFGNIAMGALIGLALGALFGTAVAAAGMKQAD